MVALAITAGAAALPAHVTPGSSSSIRSRSSSGGGGRGGGEGRGAGSSTSDSGRAKKAAPEIACPDCSDTFPTAEALLRHLLYHYPGVAAESTAFPSPQSSRFTGNGAPRGGPRGGGGGGGGGWDGGGNGGDRGGAHAPGGGGGAGGFDWLGSGRGLGGDVGLGGDGLGEAGGGGAGGGRGLGGDDGAGGGGGLGEAGGGGVSVREEVCATPRCTEPPESSSPESSLCVACWALRVAASRPGVQKQLVVGAVKAASKDDHRAARVDLVVDAIGSIGWQALSVGEPGVRSKRTWELFYKACLLSDARLRSPFMAHPCGHALVCVCVCVCVCVRACRQKSSTLRWPRAKQRCTASAALLCAPRWAAVPKASAAGLDSAWALLPRIAASSTKSAGWPRTPHAHLLTYAALPAGASREHRQWRSLWRCQRGAPRAVRVCALYVCVFWTLLPFSFVC